ncbi:MAG TPA: guanylate kinase, partial [Gammaproteobacteria bacterium]|nr:guanylate kinase [Gammaproteobacteria bacterium]
MPGTLFIIAAASGTGKTTLVRALCRDIERLKVSVSCTTRAMRPGEVNGVDYHFVDAATFRDMVSKNRFLEHETVFDHQYGTPRGWVEQELAAGYDIILEIDWQGARDVRALLPEQSISIFLLPPSLSVLEDRLRGRGQDDESIIRRRMQDALNEIRHFTEFD